MTSVQQQYVRELYQQLGYAPVWLPTSQVAVGDVGLLKNGVFTRVTSLTALGIGCDVRREPSKADIKYTSSGKVTVAAKASGSGVDPGMALSIEEAGAVVTFNGEHGILLDTEGCSNETIDDLAKLEEAVLQRFAESRWKAEHIVVREVVTVRSATIAIAKGKGSTLVVRGGAVAPVASLAAGVEYVSANGLAFQVVGAKDITPLFRFVEVRKSLFSPPRLEVRDPTVPTSSTDLAEVRVVDGDPRNYL